LGDEVASAFRWVARKFGLHSGHDFLFLQRTRAIQGDLGWRGRISVRCH
jgi:hypothetical protein